MSARIVTWSALATLICATTLGPGYAEEATAPQAQSPHLLSAATSEEQAQAHAPQVAPAASYQPQAHENQAPTEIAANLAAQPTAPSAPAPEQAAQTVPAQADADRR